MSYIDKPFKPGFPQKQTFCLVQGWSGLGRFHCIMLWINHFESTFIIRLIRYGYGRTDPIVLLMRQYCHIINTDPDTMYYADK